MWTIEVFGPGCLGVNDRSVWSGVDEFSALSWESVEVMFVLTINSSFWRGVVLKVGGEWAYAYLSTLSSFQIDGMLSLRWPVGGEWVYAYLTT